MTFTPNSESSIATQAMIMKWMQMVETNLGSWRGELITTVRANQDFENSPLCSAILLCWTISTIEQALQEEESDDTVISADHIAAFGEQLLDMVIAALVTTHNARLLEEDE